MQTQELEMNDMTEENEMSEKVVVRVGPDGNPLKCAKGLPKGCGYKAGSKVCGKCGAMAVEVKGDYVDEDEDDEKMDEDAAGRIRRKRMKPSVEDEEMVEDDEEDDEDEKMDEDAAGRIRRKGGGGYMDDEGMGAAMPKPRRKRMKPSAISNPDELDEDETPDPSADERDSSDEAPDESNAEMGETPMEAMGDADRKRRMAARRRRMASMNVKSEQWSEDAFLCGFERKMVAGGGQPCSACPGGCAPEADLPTLIEVEGLAEEMLGGKVLASGYADVTDEFIVDVEVKDGRVAEVRFDGINADPLGWHYLAEELLGEKSAQGPMTIVSMDEAAAVAVKTLPGDVINIGADVIDGIEVYAVEIEGVDGKSYDGFVTLDGELYAYDVFDDDEAEDVDAKSAEYELKKAYSDEQREMMVKEGEALEDGSFPIANESDLSNAVMAYGRAKDKEKAKKHIMKRARELDAESVLPESWTSESDEGKKTLIDTDPEFLVSLMEFEMLAEEDEIDI
jgi:hypothetical protein